MTLTRKDKIALPVAVLLGVAFGYFTMLAGFAGLLVGGFYGILVVPLVVLFVADQRKILAWQACIISFALSIVVGNGLSGGLGSAEALTIFFGFWPIGTVISSPVPMFLYWKRTKGRPGHQVLWLFVGLGFAASISSVWRDPFLLVGLSLLWILVCLAKFAWEWHRAADTNGAKTATLVTCLVLALMISITTITGGLFRQQLFRSAIRHHYLRLARFFVTIGADPNRRDALGITALVDATWSNIGDLEAVNFLISIGANVNEEQEGTYQALLPSGTALDVAAGAGRREICEALLEAGASVNAKNRADATPLVIGLSEGSIACVPPLLNHGAAVNARDAHGRTALMYLVNFSPDDPNIQNILSVLLARGIDVNAKDADGKTAVDLAKEHKHERFAEQLGILRESRN